MAQEIREEELRQRQEALRRRQQIIMAEKNRNAPVDDSQMVDDIFGFIDQTEGEGTAPSAFKVESTTCWGVLVGLLIMGGVGQWSLDEVVLGSVLAVMALITDKHGS